MELHIKKHEFYKINFTKVLSKKAGGLELQIKYKLPPDVKTACISYVRGYERRVKEYHQKRDDILNSGKTVSYDISRVMGGGGGGEAFNKTIQLQKIETHFDTKIIRAVEQAKNGIGSDIWDDEQRRKLIDTVWDCCIEGRRFVFRYYNLKMDKATFYRRRNKFLYNIAKYLDEI